MSPPQLRQGKLHNDVPAHAKAVGKHYTTAPKHIETPSAPYPKDSGTMLGQKNSPDGGGRQWAKMDAVTKRNTYTGD
jgi:hypothetical protein